MCCVVSIMLVLYFWHIHSCAVVRTEMKSAKTKMTKDGGSFEGDHVVLDCGSLLTACKDPRLITVRTSTLDCRQSHDSNPVVLSQVLIDEIQTGSLSETKPTPLAFAADKQVMSLFRGVHPP